MKIQSSKPSNELRKLVKKEIVELNNKKRLSK